MRQPTRLLSLTALLTVVGALVLPSARATVMVAVPLEELVATSDAIVHARVIRSGSRLVIEPGGMTPHTISELEVIEWLRGEDADGENGHVTIEEIGGTYPGGGMAVAGTPEFTPGAEVVVFLSRVDDHWRTRGMVQGLFLVRPTLPGAPRVVVRDTTDVGFATWETGPMTIEEGGREEMELEAFLSWIRDTVHQLGTIGGDDGTLVPGGLGTVGGAP